MTGSDDNQTELVVTTENVVGVEISTDVIEWVEMIAKCYDMTTIEVTERFLRYGAINYESILSDEDSI